MITAYLAHILSLVAIYWVLVSGLTLLVGYTGQLSLGHVGLLAIGSYSFSVIAGTYGWEPYTTILISGCLTALVGFILGLPAMRLPEFYFGMVTLAFGMIIAELAVAEDWLTGGGVGLSVPSLPSPFDSPWGFTFFTFAISALASLMSWNLARSMYGRAMVSIRESTIAAASVGVPIAGTKLAVFVFSGFTAGIAGALFAISQSYITPEAFSIDLSLYFFVAITIGGRANLVGPFLGAVFLAVLPQVVGGWAQYSTILYGIILLVVVLLLPEGVGTTLGRLAHRMRDDMADTPAVDPDPAALRAILAETRHERTKLEARLVHKQFGGVVALDKVSLALAPGEIHGLIGPNGSGKTTMLNLLSGYYRADSGDILLGQQNLTRQSVQYRAGLGIARTFQTPRLLRLLSVRDNAMLGFWPQMKSTFIEAIVHAPRISREERAFDARARKILTVLGLGSYAGRKADQLGHGAQRFLEIARALSLDPRFLLLDEPASGLSHEEIERLETVLVAIRDAGVGILLVEHHTDFVFRICGQVTTLHLGKVIAHGTAEDVSRAREVLEVYLGGQPATLAEAS